MTSALFGLEGRNAVVLGGGQGMGESTAMLLAEVGCNVAVLDLDAERAERVAGKVKAKGLRSLALRVDALDDANLRDSIARADEHLGGLDAMASIIGMAGWAPSLEMTAETWDFDHRRNLRYFFFAAQTAARCMIARKKGGAIACVVSVDGLRSSPYHASYGAAKAGLVNLVKTLAVEWADKGIRINAVAPGGIVTPRIPLRSPDEEKKRMGLTPMGRRGTTDDIAKALLFFLSSLSPYVSGQTLAVDGGYLAASLFDYGAILERASGGGTLGLDERK
jgi:NAD(P)-dependent dehydrogenase (short-subunit alcohol dehydrogenase family)